MMFLTAMTVQAQIVIGGNVYGGGNAGDTGGKTTVNIYAGDLHNVYGGARQANVGGSAFLHIDGEHASSYIVIDKAYGGNDIAGTIGTSEDIPTELSEVGTEAVKNNIDNTWNAFVRISPIPAINYTQDEIDAASEGDDAYGKTISDTKNKIPIYIGQLFGGGNGDYDYTSNDSPYKGKTRLDLGKTYLELLGGSIVYAYGGGNNATITDCHRFEESKRGG